MEDLNELEYQGETTDELLALEKDYSLTALLELFYMAVNQKSFQRGEGSLSKEEVIIPAVIEFKSEVRNGGIPQFLRNASGRYADIIVSSLSRIGCNGSARIVEQALKKCPNYKGMSSPKLQSALGTYTDQYFSLGEDLNSALLRFIREHKDSIVLS